MSAKITSTTLNDNDTPKRQWATNRTAPSPVVTEHHRQTARPSNHRPSTYLLTYVQHVYKWQYAHKMYTKTFGVIHLIKQKPVFPICIVSHQILQFWDLYATLHIAESYLVAKVRGWKTHVRSGRAGDVQTGNTNLGNPAQQLLIHSSVPLQQQ